MKTGKDKPVSDKAAALPEDEQKKWLPPYLQKGKKKKGEDRPVDEALEEIKTVTSEAVPLEELKAKDIVKGQVISKLSDEVELLSDEEQAALLPKYLQKKKHEKNVKFVDEADLHTLPYQGGMRFLIVPVLGITGSINHDPSTQFMLNIARELVARGNYVYLLLPNGTQNHYTPEPGIFAVWSDIPAKAFDTMFSTIDTAALLNKFSPMMGEYMIDAMITTSGEHVVQAKSALMPFSTEGEMPCFFVETGIDWFDSNPSYLDINERQTLQVMGAAMAYNIWLCKRDRRQAEEKARFYGISEGLIHQMLKNSTVLPVTMSMDRLMTAKKNNPKKDKFTCLFAGRTNSYKQPEKIIEVFDDLYKQGEPIDVRYITQSSDFASTAYVMKRGVFDGREYIEPQYSVGVDGFYQNAAESHLFMVWPLSEAYPITVVEALLMDMVVMIYDKPWTREVFEHFNLCDDRFWFKDKEDAINKARWIIHNREEAVDLQNKVREAYIKDHTGNSIAQYIEEETRKYIHTPKYYKWNGLKDLVAGIAEFNPGPIGFMDFLGILAEKARAITIEMEKRRVADSHKNISNWELHGLLRTQLGYKDLCNKRLPVYTMGEEEDDGSEG